MDTTPEQIGRLSLFAGLKSKPDFEKFPGTLRVRHYMPGDAICRQGEAGWTAFYILTGDDVQGVLQAESADIRKSTPLYRRSMPELVLRPAGADESVCATIYLSVPRPAADKPRGLLGRSLRAVAGQAPPRPGRGARHPHRRPHRHRAARRFRRSCTRAGVPAR